MEDPRREPIRVLYVTYDGLLEPLGRSQVLGYLSRLARVGASISVLSFEKPGDLRASASREALEAELAESGIHWTPLPYHRSPRLAATLWDVVRGAATAASLARVRRAQVVHARSYVAGLIGLAGRSAMKLPFLFDMRGFWPEERVEMGLSRPLGPTYRLAKLLERALLYRADHIVVLTESAKAVLRDREGEAALSSDALREKPITVIPCCVDEERFAPRPRDRELARRHGLEDAVVVGNIGAFSPRYLTHEMFRFAFHLKTHRPDVKFVYLTAHDASAVRERARGSGLKDDDLLVLPAEASDVPRWLSLFRLGVFFLRPSFASKGSSFTKLGELLASGVPVVTNTGVGDVDRILGGSRAGLLLPGLTDRELSGFAREAVRWLEGDEVPADVRESCRATASRYFALAEGTDRYRSIYASLLRNELEREGAALAAEAR